MVVTLDRTEARRIAVRAQQLDAPRPTDFLSMVRTLGLLQIDPMAAIAPNADLVAWTRLGSAYDPAQLVRAVEHDRTLYELNAFVRPVEDLAIHLAEMTRWPTYATHREWLRVNESFHHDVIARLDAEGPLRSRDIPDTSVVPWPSSGWTNERNVTQMLEFLAHRGEVAITRREGRQRVWDLADRVYPPTVAVPLEEAKRARDERRLKSQGLVNEKGTEAPGEPTRVGDAGVEAVIEGVPGRWRLDPAALDLPFTGRTALLSPFDRLVHDRARALQLFDFDYTLEMYKPKHKRRWGYFALPILHGDALVGKLDATADRRAGALVVHAIHEDVAFTPSMHEAVRAEVEDLAAWLQLRVEDAPT
jgi:uncharacterized protein YcaQ